MQNIEKIIVSGDLLRPKMQNGIPVNFHEKRINKYFHFFCYQLEYSTSLPVEKLNSDNSDFSAEYFYSLCGLPYGTDENWLKLYDLEDLPEAAFRYFAGYIKNALVVYIEMPLLFKRIHNSLSLPYLDLTVHPIRFLDDHLFGFSTNNPSIFRRMSRHQIDDTAFFMYANMIKSIVDYHPYHVVENSALIVGQTNVDKALYSEGRCLSIMDFEKEIIRLGETYDTVYYKAHPFNRDLKEIFDFLKQFPFIKICPSDWNIYNLLSNDNLKKVYAISSSVLYEAKYFGKESEAFYRPYLDFDYRKELDFSENTYLSIYDDFINIPFWQDILKDTLKVSTGTESPVIPGRHNRVRAAFNDYWAQTSLDPDVITVNKIYGDRILHLEKMNRKLMGEQSRLNSYDQVNHLNEAYSMIHQLKNELCILRSSPVFETNFFKRSGKKLAFYISRHNLRFNSKLILLKLEQNAKSVQDKFEVVDSIKCITYRPHAPHGGRGGGGAVLSAMQSILGSSYGKYPITYNYSESDGIWHTYKNRYFNQTNYLRFINNKSHLLPLYAAIEFVFDKTKNEKNKLYICHDYATAYGLALLRKKYILIIHSQGPRVEEKENLGESLQKSEFRTIQQCEKSALEHALFVCFPSEGAKDYYFSSKYNITNRKNVSFGPVQYNTLYAVQKYTPLKDISIAPSSVTFLSVGTITKAKGQDQTLDFFRELLEKDKNTAYRWILVGKGPMDTEVTAAAEKLEETYSNFEFIYRYNLPFRHVQYLHEIADVYIMLHRISIFDLATLEAMKHSNALILSAVGGNLEFNKDNNVLFWNKDFQKLVKNFLETDLDAMKLQNKQVYTNYFSCECFRESYSNLLDLGMQKAEHMDS